MHEQYWPWRNQRRPAGIVTPININILHLRNPWVVAWWSAAFPGFGYFIVGSFFNAIILIAIELVMNNQAHINEAIVYSFIGRFDLAKQVIDLRWMIVYLTVWILSVWGSYRRAVELNKLALLADREGSMVIPVKMNSLEVNYLEKRLPWLASVISVFAPGAGHFYCHQIPTSFTIILMALLSIYYSNILPAIHLTFYGQFQQAIAVLNVQWFLFIPSLLGFAVYDSYVNAVETNKLFEKEQSLFLRTCYQNHGFIMPSTLIRDGDL
ncbi:MAG: hypothetical protein ACM3UZ_01000 [Acidobacteriota bacterium]